MLLQHTCKLGKMGGSGWLIQWFVPFTTNFTYLTSIKGHVSRKRAAIISKTWNEDKFVISDPIVMKLVSNPMFARSGNPNMTPRLV